VTSLLPRRLADGVVTQLDDGHQLEPRPLATVMGIPLEPWRQSVMAIPLEPWRQSVMATAT